MSIEPKEGPENLCRRGQIGLASSIPVTNNYPEMYAYCKGAKFAVAIPSDWNTAASARRGPQPLNRTTLLFDRPIHKPRRAQV